MSTGLSEVWFTSSVRLRRPPKQTGTALLVSELNEHDETNNHLKGLTLTLESEPQPHVLVCLEDHVAARVPMANVRCFILDDDEPQAEQPQQVATPPVGLGLGLGAPRTPEEVELLSNALAANMADLTKPAVGVQTPTAPAPEPKLTKAQRKAARRGK